jgi:hypothetical protein
MTRTDRLLTVAISAHATATARTALSRTCHRLWPCTPNSDKADQYAIVAEHAARQAWADLAAAVRRDAR